LFPAAVAEREQAERNEKQWQEEDMATAHDEHDHGNCSGAVWGRSWLHTTA
jgi:hypothetical protein